MQKQTLNQKRWYAKHQWTWFTIFFVFWFCYSLLTNGIIANIRILDLEIISSIGFAVILAGISYLVIIRGLGAIITGIITYYQKRTS